MRARGIALLAVAAYLAFLVATIPARWAAAHLSLPPGISISGVQGTVWNGSAAVDVENATRLAVVRWHFLPARLVAARLAFAAQIAGDALRGSGEISRGVRSYEVRGLSVHADAAALAAFVPLAAAWHPQGRLALDAPALAWDGREARGSAHAQWQGATLAISDVRPLGDYRVDVRAEGGPARLDVATVSGPLRIAGHGTFAPPDALAFSGEARAEGNSAAALEPLLNLIGPRRADGARAIEWRTVPRNLPPRT